MAGLNARASLRYVARLWLFNVAATALILAAALAATCSPAHAEARPVRILALGDSLTAGYGLPVEAGFTAVLQRELTAMGVDAKVLPGGVSGDTTAGGLARLDWALAEKPDIAIVELGGNDGLRGLSPKETRANLDAILKKLKAAKVRVLLTGMYAPPNLGKEYGREFNAVFPALAAKYGVAFYPFFLEGVAARPELNQRDGIHPNPRGVKIIARAIALRLKRMIETPATGGNG
jgi:acyl-CoA thioesterase-1